MLKCHIILRIPKITYPLLYFWVVEIVWNKVCKLIFWEVLIGLVPDKVYSILALLVSIALFFADLQRIFNEKSGTSYEYNLYLCRPPRVPSHFCPNNFTFSKPRYFFLRSSLAIRSGALCAHLYGIIYFKGFSLLKLLLKYSLYLRQKPTKLIFINGRI